jgi:hypothetical protein
MFLTSGGEYKLQRKAKKLEKFVEGVFYENDAYTLGAETFRDAFVLGDGFVHVYAHEGRIKFERVLATELFTDYADSIHGQPRQLHRIKYVDVQVLLNLFPEMEDEIQESINRNFEFTGTYTKVSDQVVVAESWHLPSGAKAKDGRRTITVLGGCTLLDEEWDKPYFPFARIRWSRRMTGFFSQGGAEQIQPTQLEINKILWNMQRSYQLAGTFKVWIKTGGKIVKEHINNDIGAIIESEEMPQYLVPPIIQPEQYIHLKELKNAAFELVGVSQLSAQSKKPEGLNSGKALRTYNNIETERFMLLGQAYENFFCELANLTVDVGREIYAKDKSFSVKTPNSKFIDSIKWADVYLPAEDMITKIFPVSSLPNDPSGRLQTVQEYVQAGWLSSREGKRLMNFPDMELIDDLAQSKEDYLRLIIEKIIDEGVYTPPEPFDDLDLATELFLDYYAQCKINNVEEDKLEMLRQFNDQVQMLKKQAMAAMQPDPAAQAQPAAVPQAPPQSELLPNVPGLA